MLIWGCIGCIAAPGVDFQRELAAQTPANFKIAFIGDQGLGNEARAVLNLIKSEGAQAVLHQGDFDYEDNPAAWEDQINDVLGANFPYFASAGNHDEAEWEGYQQYMESRLNRLGISWDGDLGAKSSLHYKGIFIILVAPGVDVPGSGHGVYIRDKLAADNSIWSICSWHKNMEAMQVGGKTDETGWGVYEESRKGGAIIATAHEHSYSRTHLLSSCQNQTVASTSNALVLTKDEAGTSQDEGRTFVFVSGMGGRSIRDQQLEGDWWASIYTSTQDANHGALFGVFNLSGEANKAHFYFKDIDGRIADDFYVTSNVTGSEPPSATTISSFNPTSGPVGTEVTILGNNFNGATQVAFNGTPVGRFTIVSNSEIRATVPAGATTGKISVTAPGGTATSADDFIVTQSPPTGTTITLYPTDDAYVKSSDDEDNFGSASTLRLKQSSPIYNSYLKFLVSGLSGAVLSAKLRLRVTDEGDSGGSIFLVSNTYRTSSTPWTEEDLTYENAPSLSGNALSTVGEVSDGQWVEFDVTAALSSNGTFSFGLKNASSSTVKYSSKEGDDAPDLVIQTSEAASASVADALLKSGEWRTLSLAEQRPDRITLAPSYPNPFNAQTVIEYALPEAAHVRLAIYNIIGQRVRQLVDATQPAGYKHALWDGRDDNSSEVGSGVYLYRLQVGPQTFVRKMTLQK
ncbi:MAG: DNRLRE domain-containing protein [Anaerolineae bacterium]|nr:DNRLRE domain-containing protein [Anaerolineae bacterium]